MSVTGIARTENAGPRMGRPIMKQPRFVYLSGKGKFTELKNLKLELKNMLQNFNITKQKEY